MSAPDSPESEHGSEEPAWLHPHVHEPNPAPPSPDATIRLVRPDSTEATITLADLATLPQNSAQGCTIVSTGHGTSGPFDFEGVTLPDLLAAYGVESWRYADVVSADDFGTRIHAHEAQESAASARPILLALRCNSKVMTRPEGLVRLVVPSEKDDALRQVKWVARIKVH